MAKKTSNASRTKKQKANRIEGIRGQGGYFSDRLVPFMRKVIPDGTFKNFGGRVGNQLGNLTNLPHLDQAGQSAGGYLGGKLAEILGFGDYTVRSNSLMEAGGKLSEGAEIPKFLSTGHETRVCHREFIGDVVTPGAPLSFSNTSFKINAANPSLFPWLAPIAANFQQYRFNGLVIEFKTMTSDYVPGGAMGTVIMATNYDAVDVPFTSKIAMENSEYAISAKPSLSQLHAVECDPQQTANNLYYCRDSTAGSGTSDNRFYDLGNFQLATVGLPSTAGTIIGELWASYDVSLFKPEIAVPTSSGSQTVTSAGTVSGAVPFGTAPISVGSVLVTAATNTLTFQYAGTYYISQLWGGTSYALPTIGGTAATALRFTEFPRPGTLVNATTTWIVTVSNPQQTVVFDYTTSATTTGVTTHIIATPVTTLLP